MPSLDSFTVKLAAQPVCASGVTGTACKVYVTVSAAMSPQEEQSNGDTFLVSTTDVSTDSFNRHITLNGADVPVKKRAVVLVFDATNWDTAQTVYVYAVDDARAEGDRVVTASTSVIQPSCGAVAAQCFDHAVVRNVEVTVHDNDAAAIRLIQLDPFTTHEDGTTIVVEGTSTTDGNGIGPTQLTDIFDVQLANAPTGDVYVQLAERRPARPLRRPESSRSRRAPSARPGVCKVKLDASNWNTGVRVTVSAVDDFVRQDPHNTSIVATILPASGGTTDTRYAAASATSAKQIEALVIDNDTAGVLVLESNGSTLVNACGNAACTTPGPGDDYRAPPDARADRRRDDLARDRRPGRRRPRAAASRSTRSAARRSSGCSPATSRSRAAWSRGPAPRRSGASPTRASRPAS